MYYAKEIAEKIRKSDTIVIYGARIVAKEVANCLTGNPYNKIIEAFMVSEKDGNPDEVLGRPVITMEEGKEKYKDALIIVAILEKYLLEIQQILDENGFFNVIACGFESDLWSELRGNYFRELCIEKYGEYKTLEENLQDIEVDTDKKIHIYTVRCHVDKELKEKKDYPWELQIQAGAALTDYAVCNIRDNTGDNISEKNRKFCELTALYWIWKNDTSDYAGLGHYRRHFDFTEKMIAQLTNSDIDVILTIPIFNFPSVRAVYENDHSIEDWNIMLQIIYELHPDYYQAAVEVQSGIYYYAYNMFAARKAILNEYCEWLFPILFECEKRCKPKNDNYQERYIGFLAERLLSIFFIHNWNRWNIVHAKKNFLR